VLFVPTGNREIRTQPGPPIIQLFAVENVEHDLHNAGVNEEEEHYDGVH
jgi:hypothetical protein